MKNKVPWAITGLSLLLLSGTPLLGQSLIQKWLPIRGKPSPSVLERELARSARHSQFVRIYGRGSLWRKTIGLSDEYGILIRDKRSVAILLRTLRDSGETKYWDEEEPGGALTIDFMRTKSDGMYDFLGGTDYFRRGDKAFCHYRMNEDPVDTMATLRQGAGLRFEAFMRQMVKRARSHDRSVSFFEVEGD